MYLKVINGRLYGDIIGYTTDVKETNGEVILLNLKKKKNIKTQRCLSSLSPKRERRLYQITFYEKLTIKSFQSRS